MAGRLLAISCLLLVVAASATEEETCLFQKNVGLSSVEANDACTCLSFTEAYSRGATCGQGFEFYSVLKSPTAVAKDDPKLMSLKGNTQANDAYCTFFYQSIQENYCLNVKEKPTMEDFKAGGLDGSSWCYVSSECQQLGLGSAVPGTSLSTKTCTEGEDKLLGNTLPVDIVKLSQERNMNLITTFGHAYLYMDRSTKAPEVGAYNQGATAEQQKQQQLDTERFEAEAFAALTNSPRPTMLWPSKDDFQRKWIQYGVQRWQLMFQQDIYHGTPKDALPHGQQMIAMCMQPAPGQPGGCNDEAGKYYQNQIGHTNPWGMAPEASPAWAPSFRAKAIASSQMQSCQCIPWKEVYSDRGIECGQGLEMAVLTGKKADISKPLSVKDKDSALEGMDTELLTQRAEEFCGQFYQRLNASTCINQQFRATMETDTGSWCYVSDKCADLNGGAKVPGTSLSVKTCTPGKDSILRDFQPNELTKFALEHDNKLSTMVDFAYVRQNEDAAKLTPQRVQEIKNAGLHVAVADEKNQFANVKLISKEQTVNMAVKPCLATGVCPWLQQRHHYITQCEEGCSSAPLTTLKAELAKQQERSISIH
eukprot:gnl/TRDRNA2_/TRDRNA2_153708_c0_seq1.p1 gnl/TRDRNA2_/TRDRNA2_153708_c0~~gnl/TRDRNA2_/TRDRNA2_153708_c0_seq1.p1  ORF type:complete len:592 (-),score=156.87 gnl/TRDRNA2_/TRDRNA2_153708_c0_seq1:67-1842(-)